MKKLLLLVLLFFGLLSASYGGEIENNRFKLITEFTCEDCNLKGVSLNDKNLREAKLSGANLSGANLTGAYLIGADLSGADLTGVDLRQADLTGANLTGANLTDAVLRRANLNRATFIRATLTRADLRSAKVNKTDFTGAYLEGAELLTAKEKQILAEKEKEQDLIALELEVSRLWEEGSGKTRNEIRKELKNKIINSGYKSFTSMIKEEERKKKEKKVEEKRQRVLSLIDYPGFKDLKPGLHYEDLTEFCHLRKGYWVKCYGIDNIKFYGKFKNDVLYELILDMGPIVNTEGFLSVFGENDSNIFIKMRKTMGKNYSRDYGYSERDRQLFNESEKSRLYEVYSGGKVVLEISRKEKDWSSDLWLYIHYLDPSKAETFLNENRPVRASEDDF